MLRRWLKLWRICVVSAAGSLAGFGVSPGAEAQIQFEETASVAGIVYAGPGMGSAWGDANGDGRPDLYVSNHYEPPSLYLNQGDGRFALAPAGMISSPLYADQHGAAWGDFDNDGDQDLIQLVGAGSGTSSEPNQLHVNIDGAFTDRAAEAGLEYPLGRGLSPLWLDWNADGLLDVFFANRGRPEAPSALFTQRGDGTFTGENALTGIATFKSNYFAQITRITGNLLPTLIIAGSTYPERAYAYDMLPFQDVTDALGFGSIGSRWSGKDVAIADVDGDLLPDLFLTRSRTTSGVTQFDVGSVGARLIADGDEKGVRFRADGDLDLRLALNGFKVIEDGTVSDFGAQDVYLGSDGQHPSCSVDLVDSSCEFTVSASQAIGSWAHVPGSDFGIFVSYDPSTELWQITFSHDSWKELNVTVDSASPISDLAAIGFTNSDGELPDRLLLSTPLGFVGAPAAAGLETPTPCASVAAADFDNDMDLDLYLVCLGAANNPANLLLENDGAGSFQPVADAAGAAGSASGRGDAVSVVDYDGDGFMDLFVTNGAGDYPFADGPSELFRNLGNANHWLEIDLEGVVSNRDGIGARVLAQAGGVTQLREQNGGIHATAQNHQRLHLGMGPNQRVWKLTVEWPSGIVQNVWNVASNQLLRVVEPSLPSMLGAPSYTRGGQAGVFLWQDTSDGPYRLRVNGGGPRNEFTVRVIASAPLQSVTPFSLEDPDRLEWSESYLELFSEVTTWHDGVEFSLPADATAVIAIEKDGVANPRQLFVGPTARPLSPAGWVLPVEDLPTPPSFQGGRDLGLFVGQDPSSGAVVSRWNGDGSWYRMKLTQLFSKPVVAATPVSFESSDSLTTTPFMAVAAGYVTNWWDGVDVTVPADVVMGLLYEQDELFQAHRVNPNATGLGPPNAYRLQ